MRFILFLYVSIAGFQMETQVNLIPEPTQMRIDSLKAVEFKDTTTVNALLEISRNIYSSTPVDAETVVQYTLELAEELDFKQGIINCHLISPLIYLEFTMYDKALEHLIVAEELIMEENDSRLISKLNNIYGVFYHAQTYYDEALEYYHKSLKLFREAENLEGVSFMYNNIGAAYHEQEELDSALSYYYRALEIKEILKDESSMAITLGNIGSVHLSLEEHDKALLRLIGARNIFVKNQNRSNLSLSDRLVAEAYLGVNKLDSAKMFLQSAEKSAIETNSPKMHFLIYEQYSNYFEKLGDLKTSLEYHRKFNELKDSVNNNDKTKAILNLKAQYEAEKKDAQLKIKEQSIALLQKGQQEDRLIKLLLAIVLTLVIIIGFIFLRTLRLRRKKDQLIYEKEQQLQLMKLDKLNHELEFKRKELTTNALQFIQKNDFLKTLKDQLDELSKSISQENKEAYDRIRSSIDQSFNMEKNWEEFKIIFEQVNEGFFERIRETAPDVSPAELKLAALLRLNMSSKEIADILGISSESVKTSRSRLRKKLNLARESNLVDHMMNLN